jgi:integrase
MTTQPEHSQRPPADTLTPAADNRWTVERIRALGVTTTLATAASVLGISRSQAYRLAAGNTFPVPLIRASSRVIVPVAGLLRNLTVGATAAATSIDRRLDPSGEPSVDTTTITQPSRFDPAAKRRPHRSPRRRTVKGTTFKRCGCRDTTSGRRLGQTCPHLRRPDGSWSRNHGQWHWQIELPARADGTRRPMRHGTYPTQTDASTVLEQIRAALAVPDPTDEHTTTKTGDLIETAVTTGAPIPTPDQLRRWLHLDVTPTELPTMAGYLTDWLTGRKNIKPGTLRGYESHIRLYLSPYLGHLRIDRLRPGHIDAMYDAIDERNTNIRTLRASRDPATRDQVKGQRTVGVATQHRIHATLRKALNDAVRRYRYIDTNPALMVELPPARPPKPTVWTDQRVSTWRDTGKAPSPVMIWTPAQTGRFLDHTHDAHDRLYALYHLITFTGLRRGEACGLRWDDVDLDAHTLTVRWQIVQHGWATAVDTPKTVGSEGTVALDAETVTVLRGHRTRQHRERLTAGAAWIRTGLVFTTSTGGQLHPADVTDHFHHLTAQAGLPPIRLHDLRHGAATMGLAAGVQMKVISNQLRHSSPHFTAKFYGGVLPEVSRAAAEATAAVVPRRNNGTRSA